MTQRQEQISAKLNKDLVCKITANFPQQVCWKRPNMNLDQHLPKLPAVCFTIIVAPKRQIFSHQTGNELPCTYIGHSMPNRVLFLHVSDSLEVCWLVESRPIYRKPKKKRGKVNSPPSYTLSKSQNLPGCRSTHLNLQTCNLACSQWKLTVFYFLGFSYPKF